MLVLLNHFCDISTKDVFHVCKDPRTGNLLALRIKNRICFHFCVLAFMGRPPVAIINVVVSHDVFNSSYSDILCRRAQHLFVVASCCQWCQWCAGRAGAGPLAPAATTNLPRTNLPPPAAAAPPRRAQPRHSAGRPPRRGNTAGANLRRLLGLGVCSCAPHLRDLRHSAPLCPRQLTDADRRDGVRLLPRRHSQ